MHDETTNPVPWDGASIGGQFRSGPAALIAREWKDAILKSFPGFGGFEFTRNDYRGEYSMIAHFQGRQLKTLIPHWMLEYPESGEGHGKVFGEAVVSRMKDIKAAQPKEASCPNN